MFDVRRYCYVFNVIECMTFQTQTVSAPALVSSENGEQSLITSPPVKKLTPVQTAVVVSVDSIL